jgi:hypothetical protein
MTDDITTCFGDIKVELSCFVEDITTSFIRHDGSDYFWNQSFVIEVWFQRLLKFRRYYKTAEDAHFIFQQFCERLKAHKDDTSPDCTIDLAWEPSAKWSPNGS